MRLRTHFGLGNDGRACSFRWLRPEVASGRDFGDAFPELDGVVGDVVGNLCKIVQFCAVEMGLDLSD